METSELDSVCAHTETVSTFPSGAYTFGDLAGLAGRLPQVKNCLRLLEERCLCSRGAACACEVSPISDCWFVSSSGVREAHLLCDRLFTHSAGGVTEAIRECERGEVCAARKG